MSWCVLKVDMFIMVVYVNYNIDSLIEYNVLHLRPYFALCKIPSPIASKAIVTAELQTGLYAMRGLHNTREFV